MWTQIVGKTRLSAPPSNHWWHIPFYVSARGLRAAPTTFGPTVIDVEFDFVDHVLLVRANDGRQRSIPLTARPVAEFYEDYRRALESLGVMLRISLTPVEVETAIPFPSDREHAAYDATSMHLFWRALVQVDRVLHLFRGRFVGKVSPVHFFWGGFDLAVTRFSGRPAPPHPGGVPHVGDWVMREAYSHEVSSCGFWPGSPGVIDAAFYAYGYPEPDGYSGVKIEPAEALYHPDLREFVLPYDAVRMAKDPDEALLAFLQSTYDASANLATWDRKGLER
jgi:hypothetical protein